MHNTLLLVFYLFPFEKEIDCQKNTDRENYEITSFATACILFQISRVHKTNHERKNIFFFIFRGDDEVFPVNTKIINMVEKKLFFPNQN